MGLRCLVLGGFYKNEVCKKKMAKYRAIILWYVLIQLLYPFCMQDFVITIPVTIRVIIRVEKENQFLPVVCGFLLTAFLCAYEKARNAVV